MIDVTIKYVEPLCVKWGCFEHCCSSCEYVTYDNDIFDQCDFYKPKDPSIVSSDCVDLEWRICIYQSTLKRFELTEKFDVRIGKRCIPWGFIKYMRIKDGDNILFKFGESEEEKGVDRNSPNPEIRRLFGTKWPD